MQTLFVKIWRKLFRLSHVIQGEIWCLHRVVKPRSPQPSNCDLEISPDYLLQLISEKRRQRYSFVSMDDLLNNSQYLLPRKRIVISFDDGFADIYTNAFPILRKLNVPFILFLSPAFMERETYPWWLQLEYCYSDPLEYEHELKKIFDDPMDMQLHYEKDYPLYQPDKMLTWPQIEEMIQSGLCTIGAHGTHHNSLIRIDGKSAKTELLESKKRLEERLKIQVQHMSYPNSEQNASVQQLVKEVGFLSACIGYGGSIRRGDNPFCLNRKYITQP